MPTATHSRTRDLAVIIGANGVGGTEQHTADFLNYLSGTGLRTVLVQSGFDLRSLGLREVPGKLDIVDTGLPLAGVSRPQLRTWSALFRAPAPTSALVVKPWYNAIDLSLQKVIRKAARVVYHFEHSLPPKLGEWSNRLHFGFLPGLGLWWYKERWRRWRMSRLVDRVFVSSETAKQELLANALLAGDQVVSCTNGLNVNRWVPDAAKALAFRNRYGIPEGHHLFAAVGRLDPLKGTDLAIRSFAQLRQRGQAGAALCIVGSGPFRGELERLTREVGVEGLVIFTGYVDDLAEAYSAIDTVLFPSLLESCPLVLLEAMGCGCRIIASPIGGVPEIVSDPVCGDLLSSRDPGDWADVMQRHLRTAPDERSLLAGRVRDFVVNNHDQRRQFRFLAGHLGAAGGSALAG